MDLHFGSFSGFRKFFLKFKEFFSVIDFQFFNVSLIPTFGMLIEPLLDGQNEHATVVRGLFQLLLNLTILATGFALKDLSARNFVVIGTSLTFVGLFATAHVTSSTQLIFSFSLIVGIGIGLVNPAALVGM